MSLTFNGLNGLSFGDGTSQNTAASGFGFKNRIINGDMRIDQRLVGSSSSATSDYVMDRWFTQNGISSGTVTTQQVIDAPPGFYYSAKKTFNSVAYNSTSGYVNFQQIIEINNTLDFAYGTASASTAAISFWVKSSITGAHSFCLQNYTSTRRSYLTSYTINSANTWEYKRIIVPGDTAFNIGGTSALNGQGLQVRFSQGAGSQYSSSTSGSWASADVFFLSGCVTPATTNGATWQVTGVQLEKNPTATGFDYLPISTAMYMCERYYEKSYDYIYAPGTFTNGWRGTSTNGTVFNEGPGWMFRVPKRDLPTLILYNAVTGATGRSYQVSTAASIVVSTRNVGRAGIGIIDYTSSGGQNSYYIHYTAESEL